MQIYIIHVAVIVQFFQYKETHFTTTKQCFAPFCQISNQLQYMDRIEWFQVCIILWWTWQRGSKRTDL
jgi:hypothetical protein